MLKQFVANVQFEIQIRISNKAMSTANSKQPYHDAVAATLESALCLINYPSERYERINKPELEEEFRAESSAFLRPEPLTIARDASQYVLIEPSINCCRVSVVIKQSDEMEKLLCRRNLSKL